MQAHRRDPISFCAICLILAYRNTRAFFLLGGCRFHPTCSEYAEEAIARLGIARGGFLALRRLLRCRPFGPWGFDPVQ